MSKYVYVHKTGRFAKKSVPFYERYRGKYSAPLFPLFPFGPGISARFRSVTGIDLPFLAIPFDNGNRMSVPSFYGMQIY